MQISWFAFTAMDAHIGVFSELVHLNKEVHVRVSAF